MKRGLGKGLGALMADAQPQTETGVLEVDIFSIDNDKNQPRKTFNEEKLQELAQSIKVHGIMQPIIVQEKDGRYIIVAGERRFRAAKIAGLKKVPIIVKVYENKEAFELALIENIQREDLNPMEQAAALSRLVSEYNLKQEEVAERVGKSRAAIANLMRLLSLPESVKEMVQKAEISAGHARCLLPLGEAQVIEETAKQIINQAMSVRQAETLVKKMIQKKSVPEPQASPKETYIAPEIKEAQETLSAVLSTKVRINGDLQKGKITIDYYNKEQLEHLYDILNIAD